jgi:hypothetical protein
VDRAPAPPKAMIRCGHGVVADESFSQVRWRVTGRTPVGARLGWHSIRQSHEIARLQPAHIVCPVDQGGLIDAPGLALGAYGLRVHGLPHAEPWMQPQRSTAPPFTIHVEIGASSTSRSTLSQEEADLSLIGGGRLKMVRGSPEANFTLPERPPDEELLHPYLAPAAALFWQWSGREAMHAGAIGLPIGAVLILGEKEAGKSTTLGWMARDAAVPVLTDDLAVLDGATVLAGPRSIDLRVPLMSKCEPGHLVRNGERDRLRLAPSPDGLPLAGLVVLGWAPEVEFSTVPFRDRFEVIDRQRTFRSLEPNPTAILELASVPMVRAGRPQDLARLPEFGRSLLDYFS